jgi:hypothetical protein
MRPCALPLVVTCRRQRSPAGLNDHRCSKVPCLATLLNTLLLNVTSQESSDKGISGPIGVHNLTWIHRGDFELGGLASLGHYGRLFALTDHLLGQGYLARHNWWRNLMSRSLLV